MGEPSVVVGVARLMIDWTPVGKATPSASRRSWRNGKGGVGSLLVPGLVVAGLLLWGWAITKPPWSCEGRAPGQLHDRREVLERVVPATRSGPVHEASNCTESQN